MVMMMLRQLVKKMVTHDVANTMTMVVLLLPLIRLMNVVVIGMMTVVRWCL